MMYGKNCDEEKTHAFYALLKAEPILLGVNWTVTGVNKDGKQLFPRPDDKENNN